MFYMPLQVNNLLVFWGACVSVLPWDLRVQLDVLLSSYKSFIQSQAWLMNMYSLPMVQVQLLNDSTSNNRVSLHEY